ncbi:MAG: glycosyl transferase [Mucilaginibacter sp.]|nr:glycosyl transferase [Mucilaginibacter sp.]
MSFTGKLLYKLYYQPRNLRDTFRRFGGKANYLSMLAAEQEMKLYALNQLVIKSNFNNDGKFKISFLTGDKFIHQTLFCTYSFFKFLTWEESSNFSVNYYDDGTLNKETIAVLATRFPNIRVIGFDETAVTIQDQLPKSSFPCLLNKVETHPLFKKLIYPHLKKDGLLTFFDSDMLFIKKPVEFLNWLYSVNDDKTQAFCIHDVRRSYGYSESEILKIWHRAVQNDINSGMYSIFSEHIDFLFIENLVKEFERNFGSEYYLEQLITAIILEKTGNLFTAPKTQYIVLPDNEQIKKQCGTLHHYVNESKELYFKESWKKQVQ